MSNKKEDKMITAEETITDMSQVLSLKAVKEYVERHVAVGRAEYNAGAILVRSRHPIDELLRRGMIEAHHADSGKRIMTIRDCAFGRVSGRIYNDLGEGDGEIDATTLYTVTYRLMIRSQWSLIALVCFQQPDFDGNYFNEADYRGLYMLAPNIQSAFEALDEALGAAREQIKGRLEAETKPTR